MMEFSDQELKAMRSEYAKGASDSQWELFISECKARNLRPGVHLVFQLRRAKEYDTTAGAWIWVQKGFWITTIAALRLIAQRTSEYLGQGPEEYVYLDKEGNPTIKSEIPLPHEDHSLRPLPREPWVARATVYRKGFAQPMVGMARFEAYASVQKTDNGPVLTEVWRKRGSEQLFKCAEALALRKAFPEELGSLLLLEELKDEEDKPVVPTAPIVVIPPPPVVPQVNQTPATPTNVPRPTDNEVIQAVTKVVDRINSGEFVPTNENPLVEEVGKAIEKESKKPELVKEIKKIEPSPNMSDAPPSDAVSIPQPTDPKPARRLRTKKEQPPTSEENTITEEDIASIGSPSLATPEDNEALRKKAHAAIEEATSFTEEEAAAQGLPAPPDPIPSKEEMLVITKHVRELAAAGASNGDLKTYFLKVGEKVEVKSLSRGDWAKAFTELDKAKAGGKLKEFLKEQK